MEKRNIKKGNTKRRYKRRGNIQEKETWMEKYK